MFSHLYLTIRSALVLCFSIHNYDSFSLSEFGRILEHVETLDLRSPKPSQLCMRVCRHNRRASFLTCFAK